MGPIRPHSLLRDGADGDLFVGAIKVKGIKVDGGSTLVIGHQEINLLLGEAFVMGVNAKAVHVQECLAETLSSIPVKHAVAFVAPPTVIVDAALAGGDIQEPYEARRID